MQRKILSILFIMLIASCAMQETRIYSLNLPPEKKGATFASDGTVVVLVTSPRYLAQPYIVYRTSPYQLSISRYAKWDSSPDEMLRDAFKEAFSPALFKEVRTSSLVPAGSYSLAIDLKRFERSDEGDGCFAEIAFEVSLVSPEGKNLLRTSIARKVRMDDRSFLSLAKGLSAALGEGVQEVSGNVRTSLGQ